MLDEAPAAGEHRVPAGGVKPGAAPRVPMKELIRTNDPVRLSWLQALLAGAGIEAIILDTNTSIVEGSIGAIQRRLMVTEGNYRRACAVLADAGEER